MPRPTHRRSRAREPLAPKVPEITALFWVIKIMTTGMGEAAGDFLGNQSLVLAGAVGVLGFAAAMWLQMRARRYVAAVYWFAVAMVAVFGTMVADGLHVALGVPYAGSTVFCAAAVAVVFYRWHRAEGTLSIHSIVTRRRETYYWATVLATFALGTAAGDVTASTMNLGFLDSGILFAAVIAVPAVAWWRFGLGEVAAFWCAYVVTRPLGASFADWLGKPPSKSGVGLGDGTVTAAAAVVIVALVAYVAITRSDLQHPDPGRADLGRADLGRVPASGGPAWPGQALPRQVRPGDAPAEPERPLTQVDRPDRRPFDDAALRGHWNPTSET